MLTEKGQDVGMVEAMLESLSDEDIASRLRHIATRDSLVLGRTVVGKLVIAEAVKRLERKS